MLPPKENFEFWPSEIVSGVILGWNCKSWMMDLLLNLVVVLEAHRIKGMTPLWTAEAAKFIELTSMHYWYCELWSSSVSVVYIVHLHIVFSKAALQKGGCMEPLDPPLHADFMRLKLKGHWKLQLTRVELSCLQVTQPWLCASEVLPQSHPSAIVHGLIVCGYHLGYRDSVHMYILLKWEATILDTETQCTCTYDRSGWHSWCCMSEYTYNGLN